MSLKQGLAPVWSPDARVLILGSLPGDASLAAQQYYGHPRNAFWRLVGSAIDTDLVGLPYPQRIIALRDAHVALWDVLAEAIRPGSLDSAIREERTNDLAAFLDGLPDLSAIAFNGGKAARLGERLLAGVRPAVIRLTLPSSSPAYTLGIDLKKAAWLNLRPALGLS